MGTLGGGVRRYRTSGLDDLVSLGFATTSAAEACHVFSEEDEGNY